ncbi:EFR1 family ferrodoxin [Tepidibacter sp. Z1-5]|uniref:EFR1 family ferrodoxin n=1 Tax=Tepidibacter sp. Z1-5 TaxID=3134138 RepID=UPI0030C129A9
MKTSVYYFSGTGNSLNVAKHIAKGIENAKVVSIASLQNQKVVEDDSERLVIVTPTYYIKLPNIVRKFINKINLEKVDYIAVIATCGGGAGYVLNEAEELLNRKGKNLDAGFELDMVENSIVLKLSEDVIRERLNQEQGHVNEIIKVISNKEMRQVSSKSKTRHQMKSKVLEFVLKKLAGLDRKKCKKDICVHCGICEKVCPRSIVTIKDGYPVWNGECEDCMACIHWCPKQAISFGMIRVNKENVYHHPNVTMKEIIDQKQ